MSEGPQNVVSVLTMTATAEVIKADAVNNNSEE